MIKLAFKTISAFWIISPAIFLIGRLIGFWNFHGHNWLIGLGLMFMSGLACFLNYNPEE